MMVNRIQEKAQMKDRDPVLAYLPSEDEPFDWLVGMSRIYAQMPDYRSLLMARANNDEVGLAKLANQLLDDAEYPTSGEENDEEAPKHSSRKKTSSCASCMKRAKRPRLVKENLEDGEYDGSDGNISY